VTALRVHTFALVVVTAAATTVVAIAVANADAIDKNATVALGDGPRAAGQHRGAQHVLCWCRLSWDETAIACVVQTRVALSVRDAIDSHPPPRQRARRRGRQGRGRRLWRM
jgi:hypothetical protein